MDWLEGLNSILLGLYLGLESPGHAVTLCLTFWGSTELFPQLLGCVVLSPTGLSVQFFNPCVWHFLFWIIIILVVVKRWPLIVIFISQMNNDAEHLLRCLLSICESSLEKRLFVLCPLFNSTVVLLLSCTSYLHVVESRDCWLCRSVCRDLPSQHYWVFWSMRMQHFPFTCVFNFSIVRVK